MAAQKNHRNNYFLKIRGFKPVCWFDDELLFIYKRRSFYLLNILNRKIEKVATIRLKKMLIIYSFFSMTRRLFRIYPFSPQLNAKSNELLFSFCGAIYCFDIKNRKIIKEHQLDHNASKTLSICMSENGDAYYGEYPTQNDGKPIKIYKRDIVNKKWEAVYCFESSLIRHVHLLKIFNNSLYCFTGDEDNETKILCFQNLDFDKKPLLIAGGEQKYRTCVALFYGEAIYYITDTPYFDNKLYCLDLNSKKIIDILDVEGTVIYGSNDDRQMLFSTCVENNLKKDKCGKNVAIAIDGKNGGIKSKAAYLYSYDYIDNKIQKLFSMKKDSLSIRFFGIGTFMFPCGHSKKYIAFSSSGLKKDDCMYILQKNL